MDVTYHGTYAECGIWNWKHVLDMPSYIVTLTLNGITYTTSENAAISNGPIHCQYCGSKCNLSLTLNRGGFRKFIMVTNAILYTTQITDVTLRTIIVKVQDSFQMGVNQIMGHHQRAGKCVAGCASTPLYATNGIFGKKRVSCTKIVLLQLANKEMLLAQKSVLEVKFKWQLLIFHYVSYNKRNVKFFFRFNYFSFEFFIQVLQ